MNIETNIVGITFRPPVALAEAVKALGSAFLNRRAGGIKQCTLVADPTNEYDANAVQFRFDGVHVGFLPKDVAARVSTTIQNTGYSDLHVWVRIDDKHPDRPGLSCSFVIESDDALSKFQKDLFS